ncbi:MAG: Uma2 family endonuclease [Bacteroidia bacterium]
MITDINQLDLSKKYTYADYLTWQFEEIVEIIRGRIFKMSPAPNLAHQKVSSRFHGLIFQYIQHTTCEVFHAPFDVRLPLPPSLAKDDQIDTVVQPDICVVCDKEKLEEKGCIGPPDWVIEILSPGTAQKDLREKFDVYEFSGVKEYWLAHPHEQTLLVYRLNQLGKYVGDPYPYVRTDKVKVGIFDDFHLDLNQIFPQEG